MNTFYTAYTRLLQGTSYYFVKKFSSFPDLNDVPDILENLGMHADFEEACKIAKLYDAGIKQQLLAELKGKVATTGLVIHMNSQNAVSAVQ